MTMITTTAELARFCASLEGAPFVAVDTEFMRESTYWPKLCLVQAATEAVEAVIDPLAPGIDLEPFLDVMRDDAILKVFHAARQDVEILYNLKAMPAPLFDTQVAGMAAGFPEQVAYDVLVLAANIAYRDLFAPLEALSMLDRAVQIDSGRAEAYAEQIAVIGGFWTAVADAQKLAGLPQDGPVTFKRYPESKGFFAALGSAFDGTAAGVRAMQGLAVIENIPAARALIEAAAISQRGDLELRATNLPVN